MQRLVLILILLAAVVYLVARGLAYVQRFAEGEMGKGNSSVQKIAFFLLVALYFYVMLAGRS